MDKCLVSVIVPVYHVDHQVFLNCIRSIAGQTEKRLELLLVFDGTRTLYEDILEEPVFGDARLRLIDKEHGGVSAARNAGIEQATGKWILFADADDCLENHAVECLLKGEGEQTDLIIGDYSVKYPQKTVPHFYKKKVFQITSKNKAEFLEDILNPQTGMGFCWAKLYRRDILLENRLRFREDLQVAEDAEFVIRYALPAREIRYLPFQIYVYQMNPYSAVRRFRPDGEKQYEKSMRCIFHTVKNSGYGDRLQNAYETCVLYHFLLLTVNYSFHPGQKKSRKQLLKEYRKLAEKPLYAEAIRKGNSGGFSLSRRITVGMLRLHFWNGIYGVAWFRHKQLNV